MDIFRRILPFRSDTMIITVLVWMCVLPLIGMIVVPLFGWQGGLIIAVGLFFVVMLICWGLCGWQVLRE